MLVALGCTDEGVVLTPPPAPPVPIGPSPARADVLAAGPYHTCVIDGGRLLCWGSNDHGELGVGDTMNRQAPTALADNDWKAVALGEEHTCALRTGGSAWCWGSNLNGQLGIGGGGAGGNGAGGNGAGGGPIVRVPQFVSTAAPVVQLSARFQHTCAIDENHDLYCWGANAEGQLAQNDPFSGPGVDHDRPVRVGADSDWQLVDAGQGHTCATRAPGDLWCWGRNSDGELGIGQGAPGQIRVPQRVGSDRDWIDARAGQNSSCGRRGQGSLYCWGDNEFQQLGLGDMGRRYDPVQTGTVTTWIAITLDTFHGCGVQGDGSLWCWGRNVEGQLGTGDHTPHGVPTRVDPGNDWVSVAAGRFHTCARKKDRSVYCTGQNTFGQVGTGDGKDRVSFTLIALP